MARQLNRDERRLAETVEDFHSYLQSPWRLIWLNFVGGIFRGLGTAIGATVVFAILLWILASLVDVPLIGDYVMTVQDEVKGYAEATQYSDDFVRLENELRAIREAVAGEASY